ncbi:MAG: D-alanyl-D-alanine carboxypeptidase/D-alanyl-D-alanine-endopeptidase [Acidobacteriota bacterium]|nr:MAG: D-alanyl-D-alanine carboxypeptidase/D-alanyl-D-alanine-endopeptidase [Acidobacteriota bacterium]
MYARKLGIILLFAVLYPALYAADSGDRISQQMERLFSDPAFSRAIWGIKVQSVDSGELLYEQNANKLLMPASNMKLVTGLAALEKLGLDYRFRTVVLTDGTISKGTLKGNLVVRGSGDPSLGARVSSPDPQDLTKGDARAVFQEWADKLKERGIRKIEGDLVGDDRLFSKVPLGEGWSWDDLAYGYAAEIGALQFNENLVVLRIEAASQSGSVPQVSASPESGYFKIENQLETVEIHEELELAIDREPGNRFVIRGQIPKGRDAFFQTIAIERPTHYFLTVLKETLEESGIEVKGAMVDVDDWNGKVEDARTELLVHESPPLKWILEVLLKISQNLYAETLLRMIDLHEAGKSAEGGREVVEGFLTRIGIPAEAYVLSDGSGLSRYNLLTPEMIVRLLRHAAHSDYREAFVETLPIGGVDGTIRSRMKGTAAANNVTAKTGAIAFVRALSGYVQTKDGETLAFSMLVNHFTDSRRTAEYLQDTALEILANVSRKP